MPHLNNPCTDSSAASQRTIDSPWATAGCLISNHPILVSVGLGFLFWFYRSQFYSGDGDQLTRMVQGGIWLVQTELLSQFLFELVYQILHPFGWNGFSVINLVSCIAGACSVWVLLRFNREYTHIHPGWVLGVFASSGLFLFCTGHTEYYTLFLATLFYYGYAGIGYLRGRFSALHAALAFALAVWMHMGILFSLFSLLMLPALRRRWNDYKEIFYGLLLVLAAFIVKNYSDFLGLNVQGLSPSSNFVPFDSDPSGEKFYLFFQWGHLFDLIYGWSMRSWIFWPAILWSIGLFGFRSLLQTERLFLLFYSLGFTFFTITWHPNLGMHQDWDLFAIEAAPCLLLLLTYLPSLLTVRWRRVALAIPMLASILIVYSQIMQEAWFGHRGFGSVTIALSEEIPNQVNLNGHLEDLSNPSVREGIYEVRVRNVRDFRSHFFYTVVVPNADTRIFVPVGPELGQGGPTPYAENARKARESSPSTAP